MKRLLNLSVLLLFSWLFFSSRAKEESFRIFIVQDNLRKEVLKDKAIIELEKRPFVIEVHMNDVQGVFVNASYKKSYFDMPDQQPIRNIENIDERILLEENFNKDRILLLDEEQMCYWFYDDQSDWHRFDPDIRKEEDKVIGTKTVENILLAKREKSFPVKKTSKDIYLFFFSSTFGKNGNPEKELERKKIQLRFIH